MNLPLMTKIEEARLLKLARKQGFGALNPVELLHLKRQMVKKSLAFEQSFREIKHSLETEGLLSRPKEVASRSRG